MDNNELPKLIVNSVMRIFGFLFLVYLVIIILSIYQQDDNQKQILFSLVKQINDVASNVWDFVKPFLQILILLVIIEWMLKRLNISFSSANSNFIWNVQTIIALIVTSAFSLAALSGIGGASILKDLALVVVGFYFGNQKQTVEYQTGDSKFTIVDEHKNDIKEIPPE